MIYLIDDNQNNQRIKLYGFSFIEDNIFENYITSIEKIKKTDDLNDTSHLEFLKQSKCILLHSTTEDVDTKGNFLKGSISNAVKITEQISQEGEKIPLVLFSNKMDETVIYNYEKSPNLIRAIKKNKFYDRLFDFVDNYKITGNVDLRILAYGKNFKIGEMSRLAQDLLLNIATSKGSDILKITDIVSLKSFKQFLELAQISQDLDDILEEIEDSPYTINKFRENINSITESFVKYGKNIYNWV